MKRLVTTLWIGCLLFAFVCCFAQFGFDHLGPFALASVLFGGMWRFRSGLRPACLVLASLTLTTFFLDVFVFRHRLAVECRSWSPVWDCEDIADILTSPSGRSTAYIVGGGFLDSAYWTYISDGGLFPKHCYIDTGPTDAYYPKDFSASWAGPVFTAASVTYDESTHQLITSKP